MIGDRIDVLDHGYVELVDVMGSDRAVAEAAWVSTEASRPGEDRSDAEVRRVIRYMMRKYHTSPFEMVELKFKIRIPMDAWRQMVRHRTANVNEYSTRYAPAIDLRQQTEPWEWRGQGKKNHQGSEGHIDAVTGRTLTRWERELHEHALDVYHNRLDMGVAREQARKDLPLSTYTELYWKIDLHNLFGFLRQRLDGHAQQEIRAYGKAIADLVSPLFPHSWEAFVDYRLEAVVLSRMEFDLIKWLLRRYVGFATLAMDGVRSVASSKGMSGSEINEMFGRWWEL